MSSRTAAPCLRAIAERDGDGHLRVAAVDLERELVAGFVRGDDGLELSGRAADVHAIALTTMSPPILKPRPATGTLRVPPLSPALAAPVPGVTSSMSKPCLTGSRKRLASSGVIPATLTPRNACVALRLVRI